MHFFTVFLALVALPAVFAVAISDDVLSLCDSPSVVSETFIGAEKNVQVQALKCANDLVPREANIIKKRATPVNVCGATCDTNCFVPSGGGPDPNECHVISDALLFDSENVGALFNITTNAAMAMITMKFRSCETYFLNQAGLDLTYCRTDWGGVIDWVAFNCQAPPERSRRQLRCAQPTMVYSSSTLLKKIIGSRFKLC
ncbi:hypothetical protein EIP91_001465 [Steccherinum ochraceum]|uniref:Cyanovirin-N domain-containing protein n=1 Tax=Steccherinum ochraceum TaxID=92696 RepID=A0A4R0RMF3_9APHY|nr:hypothetical protein EIP91_001465 [Steccherinum ochraceum]